MHHHPAPFFPDAVFGGAHRKPPQVLAAPSRYIQGDGVLADLGRYVSIINSRHAAVLISAGGRQRDGARIAQGLQAAGVSCYFVIFGSECSLAEIAQAVAAVRAADVVIDSLIAVGGGKCIDAGKSIAYRLGVAMVSCPSLTSNDAPCSAVSVIYTAAGVTEALAAGISDCAKADENTGDRLMPMMAASMAI